MDLSYLVDAFFLLAMMSAGIYVVMRALFLRSIVCFTDPVNLALLLLATYFSGALFIITLMPVNASYIDVLALNFLFVAAAALISRRPRFRAPLALKGELRIQAFFTYGFAGLVVVNLIVNQIFGIMPLFLGNVARQDLGTTALPSLSLLAPDMGFVLLLIFLLTSWPSIKRVSGIGLCLSGVSALLNGSKSAVFTTTVSLLLNADYIFHLKRLGCATLAEVVQIDRRIKRIRLWIAASLVPLALLMPFYLVLVQADSGEGTSGAAQGFATRLFGGFDNLAFMAFNNLDITTAHDVSLLQWYFYPFYTRLFGAPEFQSAGQYIVYMATSDYDFSTHGLHPNSNFAIELLLQNGSLVFSALMVILVAFLLFRFRFYLMVKGSLRILDVVLWTSIVMAPVTFLFDGAYFIIKFYLILIIYFLFNTLLNGVSWMKQGKPAYYTFY